MKRGKNLLAFILAWNGVLTGTRQPPERPWTAQDSAAVRYFVTDWASPPGFIQDPTPNDQPAQFSPDGAHFFFMSLHGDLSTDRSVYELWIYSTAAVRRALLEGSNHEQSGLPPLRKLVMRSGFSGPYTGAGIYVPVWQNNTTITFIGTEGKDTRRVFRYEFDSGKLTPVTPPQYILPDDGGSDYAIRGNTVTFVTWDSPEPKQRQYPFKILDTEGLNDLLGQKFDTEFQIRASRNGEPTKVVARGPIGYGFWGPWISPNEKWAIIVYPPLDYEPPSEWSAYSFWSKSSLRNRSRCMLVNLETGLSEPLLRAPLGSGNLFNRVLNAFDPAQAFWSADSRHLLLLNTALPLDAKAPERRNRSYVIDYEVETGQWSILDIFPSNEEGVGEAAWLDEGKSLIVVYEDKPIDGKRIGGKIYTFDGQHWTNRPADGQNVPLKTGKPSDLAIRIQQSANEPPRIVAANGKNEVSLSDPDPALHGVWRAPVETIHFKDPDGRNVSSLLMLPYDFSKGKPVPLVVQISDPFNSPDAFRPDGEPGTAFAAQALAAQGFAVLQMQPAGYTPEERDLFLTSKEAPAQVGRLDAAVEMLKSRGIVNDSPIGLIGFSRSGYYVYYIVTHPGRTRVGAAIPYDSIRYGYGDYVTLAAIKGARAARDLELVYDKKSFWENKEGWLDAPAFNLDKLRTPVLWESNGDDWRLGAEVVGAFQLARRPFDFQYYPGAPHILQLPRQREAAVQSTIDWMNFWLRGREREAPDVPDRFERWRKIRADWKQVQTDEMKSKEPGS